MRYLLVYSDDREPITQALLKEQNEGGIEVMSLSLSEILEDVEIHDVIEDGNATISWSLKDGTRITNDDNTTLVNRVFSLPESLFASFHEEDRSYAYQEFWAYLSFALDSFKSKSSSPSFLGLNNGFAPMPLQWRVVRQSEIKMKTPEYYFGPRGHVPSRMFSKEYVCGEIYSFHKWKGMTTDELETLARAPGSERVFIYKRSTGKPRQALVFGSEIVLFDVNTKSKVQDERLGAMAREVARLFNQSIAEILFFDEDGELSFGSIRNQISPSLMREPGVERLALNGILA